MIKAYTEQIVSLAILAVVLLGAAMATAPELTVGRIDLNDNVLHYTLTERMVQAVERGDNPVDFWASEWSLGYPVPRTYQMLSHGIVAALYFAFGRAVPLMTVFVWVRYLAIVLLPLSFFFCARLLGFRPLAAAASAAVAPLLSTASLYGIEFGSYVWAGSGLFPQSVATHLALLAIGFGFRAVRTGRRIAGAGLLLGLTFLAHFIYGYIGALTICLMAVIPDDGASRLTRLARVAVLGTVSAAIAAFQFVPLLADGSLVNHSVWEAQWKWDSFGPAKVLSLLWSGGLADSGRLPVISVAALAGVVVCILFLWHPGSAVRRLAGTMPPATPVFLLCGTLLWLAIFCGRPAWGPLLPLLGISSDLHLHRLIGAVQIFIVLLAGTALGSLWAWAGVRVSRTVGVALLSMLVLAPAVNERLRYLANNETWGRQNLAAYQSEKDAIEIAAATAAARGGRAYPGLAAGWGGSFRIGSVPLYAFLSVNHVPAVAFLYHSMALTSDLMVRFNEWSAAHYRLFNIQTVISAPAQALPQWLAALPGEGRFRLAAAPGGGYFDLVSVPYAIQASRHDFYSINDRWMQSDWVEKRQHLWLDLDGKMPAALQRLAWYDALPQVPPAPQCGAIANEKREGETYSAEVRNDAGCFLLFKMTYHPAWSIEVDGAPHPPVMLSPGFMGVALPTGIHTVACRYQPSSWRMALLLVGALAVLGAWFAERRGLLPVVERRAAAVSALVRPQWLPPAAVALLALPVCLSLFTAQLPGGHDAFEYLPRQVEFHENISHGILLPRWAPDLSNGNGQPLFLLNPPVIYWMSEAWYLLGFDFVAAINLASLTLAFAAALSMFVFARYYFGIAGGLLAAAAYVYAPYFSVDLYVRSALAEFAAFPFYPLALYGFGRYARERAPKYLLIGAAGYAGVLLSHNPAAFLFTPLLIAFLLLTSRIANSWHVLLRQGAGIALGLGLAACSWLPTAIERGYTSLDRLLQGALRYTNHFVYPQQLLYSPWGYGISQLGPNDGLSFSVGWAHLLLIAVLWIWLLKTPRATDKRPLIFFTAAAAAFCVMMLPDAQWAWDALPLLQYIQFPWRMLAPVAVCTAVLAGALGGRLASVPRRRGVLYGGALALVVIPNLTHAQPGRLFDVDTKLWSARDIASRGLEATTAREYAPRWMEQLPPYDPRGIKAIRGAAETTEVRRDPARWTAAVNAAEQSTMEVSTVYFPGWRTFVDGAETTLRTAPGTGLIRFDVPPGRHTVAVEYTRTAAVGAGQAISAASLALLLGLAFRLRRALPKSKPAAV